MSQHPERFPSRLPQVLWPAIVTVVALGFLAVVARRTSAGSLVGYTSHSRLALVVGLAAGVALTLAGAAASLRHPGSRAGMLTSLLGVAWLAAEVTGWIGGPQTVRTAALLIAPALLPVLAHLGLSYPDNNLGDPINRGFVAFVYTAAVAAGFGRVLFYDPFLDLTCWRTCAHSPLVPFPNADTAASIEGLWVRSVLIAALFLVALIIRRMVSTARSARTSAWHVMVPVGLLACAESVRAALLTARPTEDPDDASFLVVFLSESALLVAIGLAVAWGMVRAWRVTRRLSNLAEDLAAAPAPGTLQRILARSLNDDALEVAYWLRERGAYVDPTGREVAALPSTARTVTTIERSGELLGAVVHGSALPTPDLAREIGSAARLAIDNERLRAGLLARLAELRTSQSQIVTTADSTRRRIERDLHDGAQQRLLALSFDLRLALAAAEKSGDPASPDLGTALNDVRVALEEVRELAHGIFPSILADAGLGAALEALGEAASLPVEVDAAGERCPAAVEMAAYLAAIESLEIAGRRAAEYVTVRTRYEGDSLTLDIYVESGGLVEEDFVRVGDRIGAVRGVLTIGDNQVSAVIPCV